MIAARASRTVARGERPREGSLDPAEGTIACPRHGAKFDVKTGAALTMPATKPTKSHEVKIEGDRVLVRGLLQTGDRVVIDGVQRLVTGQTVRHDEESLTEN